jgi:PhzF family phenazine biosynthesis protein
LRVPAEIALVDAFTPVAGAGNRAGVVLDARDLDETAMQRIARKVGASETAFLFPGENRTELRYFTPKQEMPFCGHATVATVSRLHQLGHVAAPSAFVVVTRAGEIPIVVEAAGDRARVFMEVKIAAFERMPLSVELIVELLRGRLDMLDPHLPATKCGGQVFLAFERQRDVHALAPRWDALAEAGAAHGIRGFYVFTREVVDEGSLSHGRYFAPLIGVREDPVTGSASGPLVAHLAAHGVARTPGRFRLEQGDAVGKPGRVDVEVMGPPGQADRIFVGGVAATVMVGEIDYEID